MKNFILKQNNRITLIIAISILLFILVLVKIFYIQVIEYKKINTLANDLWTRSLPIKADRGRILDRNGKVIVDNITTSSLIAIPTQIVDKEYAATEISKILNVSYEDLLSHFSKNTSIERVHPEGRNLDSETADKINELNIEGIYLVKESKRYYPYNELLSHVIGYTGIDNQGLSGLELKYNDYLTGKDGSINYYSDGKGNKLSLSEEYNAPTSGSDIYLTIDLDIQVALENELDIAMEKYDSEGAIGIVMNPNTGEILAMSSKPSFDPENYSNYSEEIINRNLSIWQNFEPGSTFKIVTLAAAIEENKVNLFEDTYYDTGSIKVSGATLHCHKRKGHGMETYLQVVENSCNIGVNTSTLLDKRIY